jgi:sporulation protein YlmC with PRC-barrel domain
MNNVTDQDPTLTTVGLHWLDETRLKLANSEEDVRGRRLIDSRGNEIGRIEDIIVDDREGKARFLALAKGGFLGIGEKRFFVPVGTIARVEKNAVYLGETRERVASAPCFDPELTKADQPDWESIYGFYGLAPFWGGTFSSSGNAGVIPTWIAPPLDENLLLDEEEEPEPQVAGDIR